MDTSTSIKDRIDFKDVTVTDDGKVEYVISVNVSGTKTKILEDLAHYSKKVAESLMDEGTEDIAAIRATAHIR